MARLKLPEELTDDDYAVSATVRDLGRLHRVLRRLEDLPEDNRPNSLLDLGCGIGGLTMHIAGRLGIAQPLGVDVDEERLERASVRGVRTINANLNEQPLPIADASIDLATSFGVFEHLVFYDNAVAEAARVLRDGGWFLLSMPNLGSYINRAALLLGFQPREVEVSREVAAGMLPIYRKGPSKGAPLGHVHAATLRCMRELLDHHGFRIETVSGFSPDFGSTAIRMLDVVFGNIASLSRRFIILAQRRPRSSGGQR
ncbi:MAG: class I SAM-dependent methyltransferase [Chloroflexi bacterium]|nr:class I SAM-dependent methyltransferase [Chloroflexota bacterium]